jgi:hypothetical protein
MRCRIGNAHLAQQDAVLITAFPVITPISLMRYAVQSLGQTAGLNVNLLLEIISAHPGGWHEVKRGFVMSETKISAVVLEKSLTLDSVLVVENTSVQLGA